jgi:hypothetical protein
LINIDQLVWFLYVLPNLSDKFQAERILHRIAPGGEKVSSRPTFTLHRICFAIFFFMCTSATSLESKTHGKIGKVNQCQADANKMLSIMAVLRCSMLGAAN